MEYSKITREEVLQALDFSAEQIKKYLSEFTDKFQNAYSENGFYAPIDNVDWTNGFWTGEIWLAYEHTKDEAFRKAAEVQVKDFLHRINDKIVVDHHDMGFLYTPSCVAAWKLTGNEEGWEAAIKAADQLISRFHEKGQFIQAWGAMNAPENYRLIIDCFMNIPLLYWATRITGDAKYAQAADKHFEKAANYVIRDDASAFHTYYFDAKTGEPLRGATRQGYSDDSAWARGQAWGIYGIPLNYIQNHNPASINLYEGMTNYFLNRLPEDDVCYWDLIFGDGSGQSRDSSAAAIAVCGMHEMGKYLPEVDPEKDTYKHAAHRILRSLIQNYQGHEVAPGDPVLYHGVYSWHSGKGVDEGNIWGDYYYMEALVRFWKDWDLYW